MIGKSLIYLGLALCAAAPARAEETFKEQPTTFKMDLIYVFEGHTGEGADYILTLGQVGFRTVEGFKQAVANLPEGSTLEWAPGCKRLGGEPLSSEKDLADLKALCEKEKLKFVYTPSG